MKDAIIIRSNDNIDWNGTWFKDEVQQDMVELDCKPASDNDWIYWVLEHVIDSDDFTADFEKVIVCSAFKRIDLSLEAGNVTIIVE